MAASRADKRARRAVLAGLARALARPAGPGARMRLTVRLVPYLSVRRTGRGRLRVYCAGAAGHYALVTSEGTLISLAAGTAAAAAELSAAAGRPGQGRPAAGQVPAGPLRP